MTEGLRTIKLYGELARRFGPSFRLAVSSPAEAVRALCAVLPGFEAFVASSEQRGVGYRVYNHRSPVVEAEQLHHPTGERGEIRIVPALVGAKRGGLAQILIGVALIGLSFVPGLQGVSVLGMNLAKAAFSIGASLVLGGIAQMLTPTPKSQKPSEQPQNAPSYVFNGPVNTTQQGQCVPVGYGRLVVGSAVISAGIRAQELAI